VILNKLNIKFDLRYAVTEIVLIAIAILLALAIDQWWQSRADRLAEIEYLTRLEQEFGQNVQMLDFWISRMEEKRRFVDTLKAGDTNLLLDQEAAELWQSFNVSSLPCFPPLQALSFKELVSTGQLSLLRDVAIRRGLVDFDGQLEAASDAANRMAPLEYNAILFNRFSPDVAYNAGVLGEFQADNIVAGLVAMRDDPSFHQAATAEANYAIACIESLKQFRTKAGELHRQLQLHD
jgi:hypothetical protein